MSRYAIAIGKEREKEPERVQTFGFDNELEEIKKRTQRRKRVNYFELAYDHTERIGIVYEDKTRLFTGTYVHFCKTYFLCKSTEFNKERCCNYSKRIFRTACAIIVYSGTQRPNAVALTARSNYQIQPWVFGVQTYEMLKGIHEHFPVFDHDMLIRRTHRTLKTYELTPANNSLWFLSSPQIKEGIIRSAQPVLSNMKESIGADLSLSEIDELVRQDTVDRDQARIRPSAGATGVRQPRAPFPHLGEP